MNPALMTPINLVSVAQSYSNTTSRIIIRLSDSDSEFFSGPAAYDNISSNNSTDTSERNYWAFGLLIIPLITIFGNSMVIISVVKVRSLHSAINCLILALAAADLLVALIVVPFAVYVEVSTTLTPQSLTKVLPPEMLAGRQDCRHGGKCGQAGMVLDIKRRQSYLPTTNNFGGMTAVSSQGFDPSATVQSLAFKNVGRQTRLPT